MTPRYVVREPNAEDLALVAANMRESDKDEVWASHHFSPLEALTHSVAVSRGTARVGEADGVPICVFGVQPPSLLGTVACPWMLGTGGVDIYSKPFLKRSLQWVRSLEFQELENYVDARNLPSIRWLRWLGFVIYDPEPWGRDGLLFHRFNMVGWRYGGR